MNSTDQAFPNTDDTRTVAEVEEHIRRANLPEHDQKHLAGCFFEAYVTPTYSAWIMVKKYAEDYALAAISKHEADKAAGVGGEAVAWMWEHISNESGVVYDSGLRFSKVEPTNNTFWDGKTSTRVTPLFAAAPTKEAEQAEAPSECPTCKGEGGWERANSSTSYSWTECPDCATQPQASGAGEGPDAMQIADLIDPLTRKQAPDHLTMAAAAMALRALAAKQPEQDSVPADILKYAKSMQKQGYRGPLMWARKIIDWVAEQDKKGGA